MEPGVLAPDRVAMYTPLSARTLSFPCGSP